MFFLGFWLISAPFHFPEVDSLHIILTGIFGKLKQIVLSFEFSSLDRTMLSENKCIFNGLFRQREKIQRWCWHFFWGVFVWILIVYYFSYFLFICYLYTSTFQIVSYRILEIDSWIMIEYYLNIVFKLQSRIMQCPPYCPYFEMFCIDIN